jgi:hypothetical protein
VPKIDTIQTAFVGGEFGPSLKGRTDLIQYGQAAAIMQNFLVRPFGSMLSTPGLEFINQCVTGGSTTITGVRLIPFIFSVTDCYMIEMGVGVFPFLLQWWGSCFKRDYSLFSSALLRRGRYSFHSILSR